MPSACGRRGGLPRYRPIPKVRNKSIPCSIPGRGGPRPGSTDSWPVRPEATRGLRKLGDRALQVQLSKVAEVHGVNDAAQSPSWNQAYGYDSLNRLTTPQETVLSATPAAPSGVPATE